MQFKSIGIASDHAGKELKDALLDYVSSLSIQATDFGTHTPSGESVDYPDYAAALAIEVSKKNIEAGIAICGTGVGMAMVANKFPGVRAASAWDEFSCEMSRAHNNANILCLGARSLSQEKILELVRLWLATPFSGQRHQARLDKIKKIEKQNFR